MRGLDVSKEYLEAILAPDAALAEQLVTRALGEGTSYEDVCLRVIQPAMHEVGRLWQRTEVSVAQEHVATAITQSVLARAYERAPEDPASGTLVACCPDGELHGLGLRVVADFAGRAGWKALYLGTSVPLSHLVSFVEQQKPQVVAVSTSLAINLPATKECLDALAALPDRPFIVAGGNAYGGNGAAAREVGADAFAADARLFKELLDVKV